MTSPSPLPSSLGELVAVAGPDGSSALVSLHGGHVVSWRTADGVERLFVSELATSAGGAAIRGGIPVCFPQFASLGALPKHGFARTAVWSRLGPSTFSLESDPVTWSGWPHHASLILDVLLGPDTLTVLLRVFNLGTEPFAFTGALHTYLSCADVTGVRVEGLDGRPIRGGGQVAGDLGFGDGRADVDVSVLAVERAVDVRGLRHGVGGDLLVAQTGFPDVVVWNIGADKGADMSDLGAGQWREYVCVEAAVASVPVVLDSGASWVGSQTMVVR